MKRLLLLLVVLVTTKFVNAQMKALTETGREVLLYEDGTWKYSNDSTSDGSPLHDSISTNPHAFTKSAGASFLVKSKTFNVGIYIDPSKWTFTTHRDNETNPEYRFSMKQGEGYAMMLTEQTPIDLENMREIALINARKAAVDAVEKSAEYRMVNGKKVLCLVINGTIRGIKFTYLGYYFSNESGTVQLITYSTQTFFSNAKKDLEIFLNGLTEVSK